ncbi:MAG: aminoacyl-tRNA hydrolase [Candidatus Kapaibacterium sp.]|jgi:PTH1 family peptidyl-tRNA hydrolase
MAHIDYVFVGLGNPGYEYANTRHNIGWMVLEEFAKNKKAEFVQGNGAWRESLCSYAGKKILLIEPLTYMNLSGTAVKKVLRQYSVSPSHCIAIVDEYNFPVGRLHLKQGGSDGGHNGITSLIEELQTPNFWRLRCGIAKNFQPGGMADYVLSPFGSHEKEESDAMIIEAAKSMENIIRSGPQRAMQMVNSEKKDVTKGDG